MNSWSTWYDEKSSPNKYVAMQNCRRCPDCNGMGYLFDGIKSLKFACVRCGGDGLLRNQIEFNSNLLTCAMPESIILKNRWTFGMNFKVTKVPNPFSTIGGIILPEQSVIVQLNDLQADYLCKCGHYTLDHGGIAERHGFCDLCECHLYQQRWPDLTKYAFSLIEDVDIGIVRTKVERI